MGDITINSDNKLKRTAFIRHLLDDIKALEIMLSKGVIEDDIVRVGAEQEFCLVNSNWRPSIRSEEILSEVDDDHFTTELARYNIEINLDPIELKKDCFKKVEHQLRFLLKKARIIAEKYDTHVLLTGILPTISKRELEFEFMTPKPRYRLLNDLLKELRGSDFNFYIRGIDELSISHNSVLFEACNTSFQTHLQIAPDDFVKSYNWALAISGPVLSMCANSPLLLGRELWSETRIALFQQSVDVRSSSYALKEQIPRVSFGDHWATGSIADIFKDDIAQHKILLTREIEIDALSELKQGKIPKLQALCLHNGTVYRWNRPCYGVKDGKAHLRIENRYLPAGPTVIDEMANFALWAGLMKGRPLKFDNMVKCMSFKDIKANFVKAGRTGKESVLYWMGNLYSARDLMLNEMLPIAYSGLDKMNVDKDDIERLLGVVEQRAKGMTGAQWIIRNYRQLRGSLKKDDALLALTRAIYENQQTSLPVHEWPMLHSIPEAHEAAYLVEHIMSTQLFTVNENDLAELATNVMLWKNTHHLPVENNSGKLTGLLTWTHMKRHKERMGSDENSMVADIMVKDLITVRPETTIEKAISIMKKNEIGCLPVVHDHHLVGIITIKDVIEFDNGSSVQQSA